MREDQMESTDFDADFALGGEVEYEELEAEESAAKMVLLMARVHAARCAGA